jgi:hypothetical protein
MKTNAESFISQSLLSQFYGIRKCCEKQKEEFQNMKKLNFGTLRIIIRDGVCTMVHMASINAFVGAT